MKWLFCITIFFCALKTPVQGQMQTQYNTIRFNSVYTSFPDTGRQKGHTYDGVVYDAAKHYSDNSVLVIVPENFVPGGTVDIVCWFHGWFNTIDSALHHFQLASQFIAANRNAILVIPETASNAPDSYGGKLEQPGMFKSLVEEVLFQLKKDKLVAQHAETGSIALAGHSGAYRVIAHILQNGNLPVQEVFLFDGLYSQVEKFMTWIQDGSKHHFVHWYTNEGGTDEMSEEMMQLLSKEKIHFVKSEEINTTSTVIQNNRILFVHSTKGHNDVIHNPDNFMLLLANSFVLKTSKQ